MQPPLNNLYIGLGSGGSGNAVCGIFISLVLCNISFIRGTFYYLNERTNEYVSYYYIENVELLTDTHTDRASGWYLYKLPYQ